MTQNSVEKHLEFFPGLPNTRRESSFFRLWRLAPDDGSSADHNKRFHGFLRHLQPGHNKPADRAKYMGNTAEEYSTINNVRVHL